MSDEHKWKIKESYAHLFYVSYAKFISVWYVHLKLK